MHFNRAGIDELTEAVENGMIDAVIVKDLSRLGRHKTQTALYIDYLRQNNVRVLSATESIDTFNEADAQVMEYADLLRQCWQTEQAELRRLHKLWSLRQPMIEARIAELREEIRQDEEDIDELLMLKIQRGR